MNRTDRAFQLSMDSDTAILLVSHVLSEAGFRVQRSFDLQSACASFTDNLCPHHGDRPCDCQLVVLLAYQDGDRPVTLVLHSHMGATDVEIGDGFGQSPPAESSAKVLLALKRIHAFVQDDHALHVVLERR